MIVQALHTTAQDNKVLVCNLHAHRPPCRAGGQVWSRFPQITVRRGVGICRNTFYLFCFFKKEKKREYTSPHASNPPCHHKGSGEQDILGVTSHPGRPLTP